MKIIVGLGNPGRRYERTPHNVGFLVVEELARTLDCGFRGSFRFAAHLAKSRHQEGEELLLLKPDTYMNNSGAAVGPVLRYRKAGPSDLIVVLDDADLDLGRIRIRPRGSSGGHRGLDSVIQGVGSSEFTRVRVGIGRTRADGDLVEQVLTAFSPDDVPKVRATVQRAAQAVMCILDCGAEEAMNRYNGPAE